MSGAVIDASVAIKWVIHEDRSDAANALRRAGTLAAPDLLLVECANVLWTWQRRGGLTADECALALETGRPLVTADRRFAERVEASGIAPGRVQLLGG